MEASTVPEFVTDILLFDVVGFSLLSNERQFWTVQEMTGCLRKYVRPLTGPESLPESQAVLAFIPTGDGFYVLLDPAACGFGIVLALAIRNSTLRKARTGLFSGVRAAVHSGVALEFTDITGRRNYVGDGLNDCARLLSLPPDLLDVAGSFAGDDNYVIVSAAALSRFQEAYGVNQATALASHGQLRFSGEVAVPDKHGHLHRAVFVEASRSGEIEPIRPPLLESRCGMRLRDLQRGA
jgi:hypothetical protein